MPISLSKDKIASLLSISLFTPNSKRQYINTTNNATVIALNCPNIPLTISSADSSNTDNTTTKRALQAFNHIYNGTKQCAKNIHRQVSKIMINARSMTSLVKIIKVEQYCFLDRIIYYQKYLWMRIGMWIIVFICWSCSSRIIRKDTSISLYYWRIILCLEGRTSITRLRRRFLIRPMSCFLIGSIG